MASSLDKLVDDVLIQILQILSVHAVLALRKTSRRYYLLSKLRCVWYARFCADVLARNLPPPGLARPLSLLSAAELEQRTLRALYLEQAWPRLSARALVSRHTDGRVDQVVFVPGGTEVLTVQGDTVTHWLVVSWSGFAQGLKRVAEWTPFEGVPCRVVKDADVSGVIAVGPREQLGGFAAKVLSTRLDAPFVTLCDYARVPGIVAGVWRHLLLLDTTRELGGGGLELLDWHARTTGTAILPGLPDLFGDFLDFVVFDAHILVVWEFCVSVFPVPSVPVEGQVVVEHKRVFMFQEAISRPVGFTTCVARPPHLVSNVGLADLVGDLYRDEQRKRRPSSASGMLPTLTIAARSRRRVDRVSMVMLIPLVDEGREMATTGNVNTFPYRLAWLPPYLPSTPWRSPGGDGGERGVGRAEEDHGLGACTTLCLGWSGRGVFVVGRELRLVSPGLHILPPYEMQIGPVFETGEAVYRVERYLNWMRPGGNRDRGGADEWNASGDEVDFDEGMGRFVVATERGGFEVVQLD